MVGEYVEEENGSDELPGPCDSSDPCRLECNSAGRCLPIPIGNECYCKAVSVEDCEQSYNCEVSGKCSFVDGECQLTGWWDCEKTMHCQNECVIDSQYGGCGFDGVDCIDTCP
jgi:hypothetical protein